MNSNTDSKTGRSLAIAWWRGISEQSKRDYVKKWNNSLSDTSGINHWSYEMIDSSDGAIQILYNYIHT